MNCACGEVRLAGQYELKIDENGRYHRASYCINSPHGIKQTIDKSV